MPKVELVVIGASAGGLDGLREIVSQLPPSLPATVVIVMHTNSSGTTYLPEILGRVSRLPVTPAVHGQRITKGRVLIAPPDFHVLATRRTLTLTRGPRENGFRPAIDPLFRSAARAFGPRAMGVILSGALDDGTYGMKVIQQLGGVTVVQDPEDAQIPSMPLSVLSTIKADHVLKASAIAKVIVSAAGERTRKVGVMKQPKEPEPQDHGTITQVEDMVRTYGPPTGLTCPDCGGSLWEASQKGLSRFRCHVGHQFSADALDAAHHDTVEGALWTAVRVLEEQVAMKHRLADRAHGAGLAMVRKGFVIGANESHRQAQAIRDLLFSRKVVEPGEAVTAQVRPRAKRRPSRVKRAKAPRRRVN